MRPREKGIVALSMLCLYGVFFHREILFSASVYTFRDMYPLFLSMEHLARSLGEAHWPPLWNPYDGLGRPFAADPETGVFYPPNLLLRLLPLPQGLNLGIVAHHLLAAVGMFTFLRQRRLEPLAAMLGGLVFAYGGVLVSLDNLQNGLYSATWIPWALFAFDRWCMLGCLRSLAFLGVTDALMLLGAMPELALIAQVLMVAVALDRFWRDSIPLPRSLVAIPVASVMATGLAAATLLPFLDMLLDSGRRAGLHAEEVLKHSLQPLGVFMFFVPRRFVAPDGVLHLTPGIWESALGRMPWLLSIYLGTALVFLFEAMRGVSRARRFLWSGMALGFLGISFGANFPGLSWVVEHTPAFRAIRYPEKALIGLHVLLAIACAVGIQRCLGSARRFRAVVPLASIYAGCAGFAAMLAAQLGPRFASDLLHRDLIHRGLFSVAAVVVLHLGRRYQRAAALGVVAIVAVDLYQANAQRLPAMPWDSIRSEPPVLRVMADDGVAPLRVLSASHEPLRVAEPAAALAWEKNLLRLQAGSFYGIANLATASPVNLQDRDRMISLLESLSPGQMVRILTAWDVRFFLARDPVRLPGIRLVRSPESRLEPYVYRNERIVSRVHVPPSLVVVGSEEEARAHLANAEAPERTAAVLATELPADLPRSVRGVASLERHQPDRVEIRAQMETAGLLVLADAYHPGWTAVVNGETREVVRASYFLRGVFLNPGESRIVFHYAPGIHRVGAALSALFLILIGALLVLPGSTFGLRERHS